MPDAIAARPSDKNDSKIYTKLYAWNKMPYFIFLLQRKSYRRRVLVTRTTTYSPTPLLLYKK